MRHREIVFTPLNITLPKKEKQNIFLVIKKRRKTFSVLSPKFLTYFLYFLFFPNSLSHHSYTLYSLSPLLPYLTSLITHISKSLLVTVKLSIILASVEVMEDGSNKASNVAQAILAVLDWKSSPDTRKLAISFLESVWSLFISNPHRFFLCVFLVILFWIYIITFTMFLADFCAVFFTKYTQFSWIWMGFYISDCWILFCFLFLPNTPNLVEFKWVAIFLR